MNFGLLTLALLGAQHGSKPDPVQILLTKRYLDFNQLYLSKDAAGIKKWLVQYAAPSFFNRTADGYTLTVNETASSMAQQFSQTAKVSANIKLANFGIHPNHATCSVSTHLTVTLKTGQKMKVDAVAVDTWEKINGAWKLAGIVTTSQKATPVK